VPYYVPCQQSLYAAFRDHIRILVALKRGPSRLKGPERDIRELQTQRFRAMDRVDVATLNRILSADLIYTHANGLRQTKSELIGVFGSRDMKYESITPQDTRVRIYNAAAVVTGRASTESISINASHDRTICLACRVPSGNSNCRCC
jgi:hypothetical protein